MRSAPSGALAIGLVILFSTPARAGDGGFIQVVGSTSNVSIEIDGRALPGVAGPTTDRAPVVVLRDVTPGVHRVRTALPGHIDQLRVVTVGAGEATTLRLRPWVPVIEAKADAPTGTLWVEALDLDATLDSAPLGWKKISLGGEPFVAHNVPAGSQKLTFCNPDKCLDFRVSIPVKETLALIVDFAPATVLDVSSKKQAAWARARAECESAPAPSAVNAACELACNTELALTLGARSSSCERLERGTAPLVAATPAPTIPTREKVALGKLAPVSAQQKTLPCLPLDGDRRGHVTLRTRSPAEVFLGNTRVGNTPLDRLEVPAGCVEFRLVVAGRRLEKRLTVEVEPEKLTIYDVDL